MIYILTIEGREHLLKETIDSLLKFNISKDKIKPIIGFKKDGDKKKQCNSLRAFKELILPQMLEDEDESIMIEDGSIFVRSPYDYCKGKICWCGYIKLLSHYWIGFKCIYFSKEILKDLSNKTIRPQFIDRFFRNYILSNNLEKPTEQSICYQLLYHRANGTEKQRKTKDKYIEQQRKILM